jgi:hypothetical protein
MNGRQELIDRLSLGIFAIASELASGQLFDFGLAFHNKSEEIDKVQKRGDGE